MDPIFSNLNESQIEAVRTLKGPVLIVAGAGSGKTRTLTHRIAHLIASGVPPHAILAVTFTNKAADEMKRRVIGLLRLTGKSLQHGNMGLGEIRNPKSEIRTPHIPTMGTFHSICARILRRDIEYIGRDRNFVIYDQDDQEKAIKEILKLMHLEPKELKPRSALAHIGRLKSEVLSPEDVENQAQGEFMRRVAKIYFSYQTLLRQCNALDFDDLLLETIRLFQEAPDILHRYQRTWQYVCVDEYQDTNHAQYLIISKLAEVHRNICVIGDPDQSIYRFRGADIRNILEFREEYADAKIFTLDRNYRSTQPILTAADAVIERNPKRPPKKMWTDRTEGNLTTVHEIRDEHDEAETLLQQVQRLMTESIPWKDQVILYRTHAQSRCIEEACMKSGIPYRLLGGVKFYARREVKDVLAYLHAIHNPSDAVSLIRILNVPPRKIGKTTLEGLQEYCREERCSLFNALKKYSLPLQSGGRTQEGGRTLSKPPPQPSPFQGEGVTKRFASFVELIQKYQRRREEVVVSELTQELLKDIEMEKWLRDDTTEGEERWENVKELLSVMRKYDELPPLESFQSFLEEAALVSEVDSLIDAADDALTLMTMHLCKGLEFRAVHIVGCEEGLIPHANANFDNEQLEEERRLLYVAMTRAKDHLHLYFAQKRLLFGDFMTNEPSRFLLDIPDELLDRRSFSVLSPYIWDPQTLSPRLRGEIPEGGHEDQEPPPHPSPLQGEGAPARMRTLHPDGRVEMEFDQDFSFDEENQEPPPIHGEPVPTGTYSVESILRKGVRIAHPVFGEGTVTSKSGDVVEIAFDSGSRKRLALSIAPIRIIE